MGSIIFLVQLGADGDDPRVRLACEHLYDYAIAEHGGLSADGRNSGLIHCLQGNLCAALIDFGYLENERLQRALDWLARSITGEGIVPNTEKTAPVHYLRSGNSGPGFECSANNHRPCAWGGVKAMLALSKVPAEERTSAMEGALEAGVAFLLSRDPATVDYPTAYDTKPNRSWFKSDYPNGYVTDVLQNLEVLTALATALIGDWPMGWSCCWANGVGKGAGRWNIRMTARCGWTSRKRESRASGCLYALCASSRPVKLADRPEGLSHRSPDNAILTLTAKGDRAKLFYISLTEVLSRGLNRPVMEPYEFLPLREPTFFILLSLAAGNKHGYAILQDVEALSDGRVRLSTSTLYEALARLLDQELIERVPAAAVDDADQSSPGRPRKFYRLTFEGQHVLDAELGRLLDLVAIAQRRLGMAL